MCNLYSITTNQAAIAALFRVVNRYVGNLAPMACLPSFSTPTGTGAHGRKTRVSERGVPNTAATLASRQAHDTAL